MNAYRLPPLALLASSITAALATTSNGYAATIVADGTICILSNAITAANTDAFVGRWTADSADQVCLGLACNDGTFADGFGVP